jgi:putative MATE family efflux protein
MSKQNLVMTNGHPGKLLTLFALPLMAGNVFQQLYTVVDIAIVGRGVGMDALAALGTVDWMNWMYLGIAQGLSQGFSVRIAQKFGQGDGVGLRRALGNAARLAIIIGLITTVLGQVVLGAFMQWLQVPPELQPQAELYSRVIMLGIPAMMFYNFTASVLRAVGDSKTPLLAMVVAAVTNIVLDCVAVFLLDWGIAGAAGATVLAQIMAGTICMLRMLKTPLLRFRKDDMASDRTLTRQMLLLGLPVAAQNVIIAVGGMALQTVVNRFDTAFIAGYTATNKLYGLLEIAAISYGYAVTTYTGQNFGAGLWKRIREGTSWAIRICLMTAVVIAAVMILFGRYIVTIFLSSEDPALFAAAVDTAYHYLCAMAVCLPTLYLLYVYRAALQGMGDTKTPLLSSVVEVILRVGGAVLIGYTGYQYGIFYAEVAAWIGAAILLCVVYYNRVRKLI